MTAVTSYNDEIGIAICAKMAEGEPLSKVVKGDGMPSLRTVYRWLKEQPTFAELYSHARVDCAHSWFNENIEIADEAPLIVEIESEKKTVRFDSAAVARNRERIHARQWACARLLPRVYGDKLQLGGAEDLPPIEANPIETARRLAFILAMAKNELEGEREPLRLVAPVAAEPEGRPTHGTALDGTTFRYGEESLHYPGSTEASPPIGPPRARRWLDASGLEHTGNAYPPGAVLLDDAEGGSWC